MTTATLAPPVRRPAPRAVRTAPPAPASSSVDRADRAGRATRLTRRGRLVVTTFAALLVLALLVAVAASVSASTSAPSNPAPVRHVVVQPGQTLWQLAVQVAPGRDPRDVVQRLEDVNALSGPSVVPGQSLVVPSF